MTIYPGANRDNVLGALRDIASKVQNAGNAHGPAHVRMTAYLEWATNSVRMLERRVSTADIDRLVLTPGYERLLVAVGTLTGANIGTQRVLNGLVDHEIQQRSQALEEAIRDLDTQGRRWPQGTAYAVADTSFYIEYDDKLRDIDFAPLLPGAWLDKPATIIMPIIVLDELDGLKQRGGTTHVKWRASYTLAVLDDIFARSGTQGVLRQAADGTRGAVLMDILYDPQRHQRLPGIRPGQQGRCAAYRCPARHSRQCCGVPGRMRQRWPDRAHRRGHRLSVHAARGRAADQAEGIPRRGDAALGEDLP
ncbi:MAG: hypothetical protein ACRDPY_23410 [Streptosporangiaceae bacterium]